VPSLSADKPRLQLEGFANPRFRANGMSCLLGVRDSIMRLTSHDWPLIPLGGYPPSMIWKTRYGLGAVRSYQVLIDPMIYPLRPKIVKLCRELGARTVIDIASGTGAQCRMLGRIGIQATGVDLAEAMIDAATRRGGPNTRYALGSATDLPFEDATFDACTLLLALHEHPESERALMMKEANRVVRPGGHLILADFAEPERPALHAAWRLIRFIEYTAGDEHHAGFLDYVSRGSLRGLLERFERVPSRETSSHFGAIGIAALPNTN